ncbi:D-glycero-beta-D-manno-heptose 1,7-bisphosphate 7-phosphatase [Thalassotalea sp. PS06]|uniref:D-glycero-beta-D-manno-heptose 1,7-bisphosphate 7-phosphatase n=1 Tax=Thalassotalea sp. PS06 TaxID=2594005 RepID=UPI0011654D94|nr:D-glycero-beta-D-manno-heptose 1,7-bisphosphate 7-phosphatase [Thalassotalea sp. PS06]QDP00816.1 D-glycero-beta-D-manno-heptose 1,7-bisphosphate 7-phosphatase [Thalassotalea sp. PS06]
MTKALFLDRDGIINIDHGYVSKIELFDFMPGIFEICFAAQQKGYLLIVVTNQSGIGRGKYTEEDFHHLTDWMKARFAEHDVTIDDVMYCPHHPTSANPPYLKDCLCRKPGPGMILDAASRHDINLSESIFLGDKRSDMEAAIAGNVPTRLFLSGHYPDDGSVDAHRIESLADVSKYLID